MISLDQYLNEWERTARSFPNLWFTQTLIDDEVLEAWRDNLAWMANFRPYFQTKARRRGRLTEYILRMQKVETELLEYRQELKKYWEVEL